MTNEGDPLLRRENKIRSRFEFERVFATGTRLSASGVVCYVAHGDFQGPRRVGVVAGRRVGGAVQRNRAKRCLREAARQILPELLAGTDMVLVATSEKSGTNCHVLGKALLTLILEQRRN